MEQFPGDPDALVFAAGCAKAYVKNQVSALSAPVREETEAVMAFGTGEKMEDIHYLYAPAADLAALCGFACRAEEQGRRVFLERDGFTLQAADGNVACYLNERVCALPRQAEFSDGRLWLPVRWFAEVVLGLAVTERDGAVYCSKRGGRMSKDMAVLIKEMLG